METSALMTRIMDKLDTLGSDVKNISERIIRVEDTVKRHDETTFPEMKKDIKEVNEAVKRVESKQNEDMVAFTAEKNKVYAEINSRLKPLEDDRNFRIDIKNNIKKKAWESIWEWVKLAIVAVLTWIITHYNN